MAIGYNPKIATDGLILAYDESNPKSGDTSELVLGRTAIVQSTSERRFNQDDLLTTTYASVAQYNSAASGSGFSFSSWIRRTAETTGFFDTISIVDNGGPRYRMLYFGWYSNTTDRIHCSMPFYNGTDAAAWWSIDPYWSNAGLTLSINQWYNFCATYNNSSRSLKTYINGIFALGGTRPGLGDLNNPNNAQVKLFGCNGVSSGNSQITSMNFYNKELSSYEVQQNFEALRGRYGI